MKQTGAISAGFAALTRGRLILLLTFCAVVLGALSAAPLAPAMRDAFQGTLAGDHVIRNHPAFAPIEVIDFLREKSIAIAGARQSMVWAALLGVLLQIFFAGGIVETLGRDVFSIRESRAAFWAGSRRHFGHNLKCFALFALLAGIGLGAWLGLTGALAKPLFRTAPPHSGGRGAWSLLVWAVALWIFGSLTLLYDFARSSRRWMPGIGAVAAFQKAWRQLRGLRLRGLGVLLFWSLAACAALVIVFSAAWAQRTPSGPAVAVNLALLLLLLAVRPAARIAAWGSVLALFDASEPSAHRAPLASRGIPFDVGASSNVPQSPAPEVGPLGEPAKDGDAAGGAVLPGGPLPEA